MDQTAKLQPPADLIVHHAKVITADRPFRIFEALAIKDGRVAALGEDEPIFRWAGPKTRVLDADGRPVLPGLYDSHAHPLSAATSELHGPLPRLRSLQDVFAYLRRQAAQTPAGEWIVVRYAFPTRLDETRFPTRAELDQAAPRHPVYYHAGPAGVVNSLGLKAAGITRDTPDPPGGKVVKDPATGEPTGLLRNANRLLKGLPTEAGPASPDVRRQAIRRLFGLYNSLGLTSVGDRNAGRDSLDVYLALRERGELTVRVNVARSLDPSGSREQVARNLDALPGPDGRGGPTGVGDDFVRIGPIKLFMDGGMLSGSAYMRQPWPRGAAYQIAEDNYRGQLFIPPEQLRMVLEEAARRHWQVTAHTAGEGAMDVLLDGYEFLNRQAPIRAMRYCISHANFPSPRNLELCQRLGVCADVQPAWLWKDGSALLRILGRERMRGFQPYKTWLRYTTIGGGSDHMIGLDSLEATNPWNPWLGIWITLARATERGDVLTPEERLTREQAIRLYTINNAYLNHEEKEKGSLEVGKLGDLIVIDRDVLTCPLDDIPGTKVAYTVLGGKVVYEGKG